MGKNFMTHSGHWTENQGGGRKTVAVVAYYIQLGILSIKC